MKLNAVRTRDPHGIVGDDDLVDADDDHDSNGTCFLFPLHRFHVRFARSPHPALSPNGPWEGRG